MVDFIAPFQFDVIFIDLFAGGVILFMLLFAVVMLILAAKFRMPGFVVVSAGALFSMLMYSKAPIFFPVSLIFVGLLLAGVLASFFNK